MINKITHGSVKRHVPQEDPKSVTWDLESIASDLGSIALDLGSIGTFIFTKLILYTLVT